MEITLYPLIINIESQVGNYIYIIYNEDLLYIVSMKTFYSPKC